MKTGKDCFKATRRLRAALLTSSALVLAWALPAAPSRAASDGTWLTSPGSGDYGTGSNWDGGFVPVGTASFGASNTTSISISSASVGGWTFNAGASNYTFDVSGQLHFSGAGIAVSGGSVTININAGAVTFQGSATAGNATINVNNGSDLSFSDNSTAGNAAINNNSQVEFLTAGPLTAGSIAGNGIFDLGNSQLTVGSNNSSTEVGGVILGAGGSLVKIGAGTLTLSGANSYTGGTTINDGTLQLGSAGGGGSILGTVTVGVSGTFSVFNGDTSGITSIANSGTTIFHNASSASSAAITNNGTLYFFDTSTAGDATITNGFTGSIGFSSFATAGSATITNNGAVTFSNNSTAGTANITNTNTGMVSLFDNATLGSASITNNYKLFFYGYSTAGNATIANNANLTFKEQSTAGGATITNNNNGNLTFYDTSTASTTTITNNGYMYFYGSSTAGSAAITNNNWLSFNETSTAASATLTNNSSLYFYNNSTAGSATIANANLLVFRDSSTAGSASITNSGTINFVVNSTAGSATITNNHANVYFLGASSAGYATINNNAYTGPGYIPANLQFGTMGGTDTSTAGHATINNNGGLIYFYAATNAGTATIINEGQINFLDQSSAGGATITNRNGGATYFVGYGANENVTAGNAVITNNDRSATYFQGTATAGSAVITTNSGGVTGLNDNSTGGDAQFITNGTGRVDFSFSRGTNGDGRIAAGSIAGSGFYYIGNGNTLVVGGNNLSTTVSGVIDERGPGCYCAEPGNLEKAGSGTLTLSGTNSYTGTTVVNGGMLQVDGSIASSSLTTVNAGGALSGAGTVGNTVIASGGILLAGNGTPGSSLTVAGNLAFQSGALYLVTVNASAASSVNVTGTATLGGGISVSIAPGSAVAKHYALVSAAGGRSGTFTSFAITGMPSGLAASVGYDANHAYLNFALDYGIRTDLNTNQKTVAATLQNFFDANGGINAAFVGRSANGLSQLSGESATGSQQTTFSAMSQFLGLLTDPSAAGRDGGTGRVGTAAFAEDGAWSADLARRGDARDAFASLPRKAPEQPSFDPRWAVWATAFGGAQSTAGNAALGSASTTGSIYGTAVGADIRLSPNTIAGFALAGGGTNFGVSGLGGGRSDLFQAGAFARHEVGAAYITGALAYGWQDVTTDRTVTVAGADRLRAEFDVNASSGRIEAGYRFLAPWAGGLGLTPYAAGQVTRFDLPAYAESVVSGTNTFALAYAAKRATDARGEIGLRTDQSFVMTDSILTLRGRLAWAHDSNTDRSVNAAFQSLPGAAFTVSGAQPAADSALVGGRAEMKWRNGISLAGTVEGEFSRSTQTYTGKGTVRYEW